ncbi:2606_t:CDS:1, partial [Acaulospora morrowiae]
ELGLLSYLIDPVGILYKYLGRQCGQEMYATGTPKFKFRFMEFIKN